MNRLRDATSPYLLQHAGNPVDWWPWSDEAFAEAERRDVLVLLSVGYAACHWCHVMAHESFEDPATAALLNEHMVAIKVDREERPDVDSVYMTATQLMTGQGGWPMTVVMTPGKEPVFCGTYLPRAQFRQLIGSAAQAWRDQRDNVLGHARQVTAALAGNAEAAARAMRGSGAPQSPWTEVTAHAVTRLGSEFDAVDGGFGGAPKFPPSMLLEFLLRHYEGTGNPSALAMASGTLDRMARGGMYDQLGGGFARYSVDGSWVVPHFEKMLYDNALLARVYAHHWRATGSELSARVAAATCDWMLRELRTAEGGLAASLDADSEGEEGKFYVWWPSDLTAVLGAEDGAFAASVLGVTEAGTFEHGASVLQLRADPSDPSDQERLERVRAALFEARSSRVRPGRDDKVVAAWNGLAIAALAECGVLLRRPDFVAAAVDVASLLASVHILDGRIARTSRNGVFGGTDGVLEDYACVADGFMVLSGVTGDAHWLRLAGELLSTALTAFADGSGGFYDSPADAEKLIFRPSDPMDNATPSGTFALASALVSYGALTGSASHRQAAVQALAVLPAIVGRFPRAAGSGLAVAEALIAGPAEVAVVGPAGDPRTSELVWTALHVAPPGAVLALGSGTDPHGVPLLEGRGLIGGAPAAYVCQNFACQLPVTTGEELRKELADQ